MALKLVLGTMAVLFHSVVYGAPLTVFYTSNRQGEIDPCGCVGAVQNWRDCAPGLASLKGRVNRPASFVDAGDTFFSVGSLPA